MSEPLKPCPFCGREPTMDDDGGRRGTSRQSCIVVCGNCGASQESSDEGNMSGRSWNERAPEPASRAGEGEEAVGEATALFAFDMMRPPADGFSHQLVLVAESHTLAAGTKLYTRPQAPRVLTDEQCAKIIYEQVMSFEQPKWVPWVECGNSFAQDLARRVARALLAAASPIQAQTATKAGEP